MMLQACLNGGTQPDAAVGVPRRPAELAAEAQVAIAAGAESLHVHPRDAAGVETLAPDAVAAALTAIRAAVPGVGVGIGTGDWIAPGGTARHDDIAGWTERPDFVSINLREPDAPTVMDLMIRQEIGIEAGLWTLEDARRFTDLTAAERCLRILIELPDCSAPVAKAEAARILAHLAEHGPALPILLHGCGRSAWPMLMEARLRGLSTRMGLEDVQSLPDGTPVADNAPLIAMARDLMAGS
ncbi:MAG: 3-keto-5-aminohexanoate cleavage protein [Pseudomonadota bacterium]